MESDLESIVAVLELFEEEFEANASGHSKQKSPDKR